MVLRPSTEYPQAAHPPPSAVVIRLRSREAVVEVVIVAVVEVVVVALLEVVVVSVVSFLSASTLTSGRLTFSKAAIRAVTEVSKMLLA